MNNELKTIKKLQEKYLNGEIDFIYIREAMNRFTRIQIIKKTVPTFILAIISIILSMFSSSTYVKLFAVGCTWIVSMLNLYTIYLLLQCKDKFLSDFKKGEENIWRN